MSWRGAVGWLLVILLVGGVLYWRNVAQRPKDLDIAVERGVVTSTMEVQPSGDGSSTPDDARSVRVTLHRPSTSGELTVRIPAGAVLGNAAGYQRLITGRTVLIHFGDGEGEASQTVETFCLEPFKPPPVSGVTLSLEPSSGVSAGETAAGELAECLQDFGDHSTRQMAVWLVSQNYLDKPYDEVRKLLLEQASRELSAEINERIQTGLAKHLRKVAGAAGEEMIQQQVARFTPEKLAPRIETEAAVTTDAFLRGFVGAGPLLNSCGHKTAELAFFRTAPPFASWG